MKKYKLNIAKDVDVDSGWNDIYGYILNTPAGFKLYDEDCHVRGFDTMKELKEFVKWGVVPCNCKECLRMLENEKLN